MYRLHLAELDTEKMPIAGGTFTGDVTFRSGAKVSNDLGYFCKSVKV